MWTMSLARPRTPFYREKSVLPSPTLYPRNSCGSEGGPFFLGLVDSLSSISNIQPMTKPVSHLTKGQVRISLLSVSPSLDRKIASVIWNRTHESSNEINPLTY